MACWSRTSRASACTADNGHQAAGQGARQLLRLDQPPARSFIWEQAKQGDYAHGVRTWWLDACEPELRPEQSGNLRYHLGPGLEVGNIYPLLTPRASSRACAPSRRTRSSCCAGPPGPGSQRYGALVWSGDIDSTFDDLRRQITAGLNIGLSGIPWWTTDIGGFKGGDITTPGFRELIGGGSSSACSRRSAGCTASASRGARTTGPRRPARTTRSGRLATSLRDPAPLPAAQGAAAAPTSWTACGRPTRPACR